MASVFLSYSRNDLLSARLIALALTDAGHSVWWDRDIKGGARYAREIDRALSAADVIVVLWSAHSIDSAWVRDEAEAGRDSGRLVPTTLDGSRPPLGFRQYQTIDLSRWRGTESPADLHVLLDALSADRVVGPGQPIRLRSGWTDRRKVLSGAAGLAVVASAGGAFLLSWKRSSPPAPAEVQPLLAQAKLLMDQNSTVAQNQAIGLYERVVKLAPEYAEGWGRLGLICAICSHYRERSEALALRAKAVSAGNRALQLDSSNVYGELSLAAATPFIGYWAERSERMTRALAAEPANDDLLTYRAVMLQFEGRAAESIPLYERISEKPLRPAAYNNYIKALWTAGRPVELDDALNDAASLYPSHPSIWSTRFQILAFGGRIEAAAALVQNTEGRPPELDDEQLARLMRLVRAIGDRNPPDVTAVMGDEMKAARLSAFQAETAIRYASALRRLDDAFGIAQAYYFGHGYTIPDYANKGSAFSPEQRQTRLLFEPVTVRMRADGRFEPLVKAIGLDRYWRQANVQPDYRRA